jgi:hypothetical protein
MLLKSLAGRVSVTVPVPAVTVVVPPARIVPAVWLTALLVVVTRGCPSR